MKLDELNNLLVLTIATKLISAQPAYPANLQAGETPWTIS